MSESAVKLEDLVVDAAKGNEAAWWLLWEEVEPRLETMLRNPRITGKMSQDIDDLRNILLRVVEKLRADDNRRLKRYVEQEAQRGGFAAWVTVVTKRVAIDYMRSHELYVDRRHEKGQEGQPAGEWVLPAALPSDSQIVGKRPPVTNRGSALALLRYAYESLPADQMAALELWILNHSYEHIATELSLESPAAANKVVRAALERIRRRFRNKS